MNKVKSRYIRYGIVVACVVAILFALFKVLSVNRKLDTYLVLGDYLSVSGKLENENIKSFSSLLGDYFISDKLVSNVDNNYVTSSMDSELLLEMICKDAYSGNDEGLVNSIKSSKYITVKIYESMDIMTPGLNIVLGDPYLVEVERTIPNV